jgi:hypothetical protein
VSCGGEAEFARGGAVRVEPGEDVVVGSFAIVKGSKTSLGGSGASKGECLGESELFTLVLLLGEEGGLELVQLLGGEVIGLIGGDVGMSGEPEEKFVARLLVKFGGSNRGVEMFEMAEIGRGRVERRRNRRFKGKKTKKIGFPKTDGGLLTTEFIAKLLETR